MNIKLIVCTVLVHNCLALSDYCRIEQIDCDEEHIGCVNNTKRFERYTEGVTNVQAIDLTERLRNEIFYKFNLFKNEIAGGKFNQSGFPPAARMKIINWNDELEYLAKLYAEKIPIEIHLCTLTENSEATYYLVYQNIGGIVNLDSFIDDAIESIFNELKQKDLPWHSSYFAETEQIGCGIAEFTIPTDVGIDNDVVDNDDGGGIGNGGGTIRVGKFLSLRCIFDTISESRDTYQIGVPCSLCKNTICDEVFTSLCKE